MRASIRQVAERAGVSAMTVSRALKGREHVNAETYERVLEAVHALNYVPVQSPVQKRHVTTHAIGIVPFYRDASLNPFDTYTFEGFRQSAAKSGHDLFLMLRGESEWMANREELRFLDRRTDGFIFLSPGVGEWENSLISLADHGIPTVVCYRREVPEGVAWVDPDNEGIIRLALECLWKHGHQRIAYLDGPGLSHRGRTRLADLSFETRNYDEEQRQTAFRTMMREHGSQEWDAPVFQLKDPHWQLSQAEADEIFASGATAIVCINDHAALQVWDMAEAAGLRVPQDLSIIGVDDFSTQRKLTTVSFGYMEVGRQAVEVWLQLQGGADAKDCCRFVPVQLIERDSTAPPPIN